jgi:hypothetical protein
MGRYRVGRDFDDVLPDLYGSIDSPQAQVYVSSVKPGPDCACHIPGLLLKLSDSFQGQWIIWRQTRSALVDIKRFLRTPCVYQSLAQRSMGRRLVRKLSNGPLIFGNGLVPLPIPGIVGSLAHCLLKHLPIPSHAVPPGARSIISVLFRQVYHKAEQK